MNGQADRAPMYGVAVDAGSGLEAAIRSARGTAAEPEDSVTFKRAVITALGPHATTVLVDAHCGPELLADFPVGCAPMLAYEADVYHISDTDRVTVLPAELTIADYGKLGVSHLKFFMYFAPDDDPELNERKLDILADIGAQCRDHGLQYLAEPLVYDRVLTPGTVQFARQKPDLVRRATAAFADQRIGAQVLKVEVPVDLNFVDGFGVPAMSRAEALAAFKSAARPAVNHDLVYLSAGVSFDAFEASLALALEAGVDFAGFMCGRAIWSDAVTVFGDRGEAALMDWLADTGTVRLKKLIAVLN